MGLRERLLRRLLGGALPPPPAAPLPRAVATLDDYVPLHPGLRTLRPEHLRSDFVRDPLSSVEEVHPEIFAFRPVTDAWRQQLVEEIIHFEAWAAETGCRHDPPNSMNSYGVVLDRVGFQAAMAALMEAVVSPLAVELFPAVGGGSLDSHHGFAVEYRPGADVDLGFHVDASDVTLNLCLGSQFEGGDLYFEGRRCGLHRQTGCSPSDRFTWAHTPGVALLHAGKHRHGALEITQGERLNLILWCHSSAPPDDEQCADWCARSMAR